MVKSRGNEKLSPSKRAPKASRLEPKGTRNNSFGVNAIFSAWPAPPARKINPKTPKPHPFLRMAYYLIMTAPMELHVLILPGDGIGVEVTREAVRVLERVAAKFSHKLSHKEALLGGIAIHKTGSPFP